MKKLNRNNRVKCRNRDERILPVLAFIVCLSFFGCHLRVYAQPIQEIVRLGSEMHNFSNRTDLTFCINSAIKTKKNPENVSQFAPAGVSFLTVNYNIANRGTSAEEPCRIRFVIITDEDEPYKFTTQDRTSADLSSPYSSFGEIQPGMQSNNLTAVFEIPDLHLRKPLLLAVSYGRKEEKVAFHFKDAIITQKNAGSSAPSTSQENIFGSKPTPSRFPVPSARPSGIPMPSATPMPSAHATSSMRQNSMPTPIAPLSEGGSGKSPAWSTNPNNTNPSFPDSTSPTSTLGNRSSDAQTSSVNFRPYMAALERRISRSWHNSHTGSLPPVKVSFNLNSLGEVSDLRIVHSCGNQAEDNAASVAVLTAAPFGSLPIGSKPVENIDFSFSFDDVQNSNGSLGLRVSVDGEAIKVVGVEQGSSAEKAGIKIDDKIIAIGGRLTNKMTSDLFTQLLASAAGSAVTMTISRGDQAFNVTCTKATTTTRHRGRF